MVRFFSMATGRLVGTRSPTTGPFNSGSARAKGGFG